MPSITDIQQQPLTSSNISGKSTPPPPTQTATTTTTSIDVTNADPLTQAILMLEKKQRNLGKRKEKLEGYQAEAKKGKELNKDQQEALAKYPDVLGQIECLKELSEQFKKIQTESAKNQKRLSKQAADEKRQLVSQSLRQYAQIRYLIEHRPTSLKPEESLLLDKLSTVIIPLDNSSNSISRSVDIVLSIYQNGPASIIKNLTEKTPQEVREILEELIKNSDAQQQQQEQPPPQQQQQQVITSPAPEYEQEKEQSKEVEQTNTIQPSNRTLNDYPLQFDTRNQQIPLEQIMQDTTFFPNDLNNELEDNNRDQSPDPKQYFPTMTVVNSSINDQSLASIQNQQQDNSTNVVTATEEQHVGEQGQYRRGNGSGNRNYNRGGQNHYNQHQWRGPRGGRYHSSYGSGQRGYNENNRGRGAPNYRNNRGGGYRGNNRGYNNNNNNNGNGYQKSAQYQQAHSAPPS